MEETKTEEQMEEKPVEEVVEETKIEEVKEEQATEEPKEEAAEEVKEETKAEAKTGFEREMHKAICDDCGKECEVPFKPIEGRKIYCRDCYRKHKPRRF